MYHISLLWQCWAFSVERGAMGAIYNARFPVKIHISGIFSLSMSMKGVLQNKNHSIWLRNYSSVHDLILEARWVQRKSTSYYIDRRIRGNSIYESIKLLRYYSVQTQLKFQQFSSCFKSIAKPSVAFRNTSASIHKQINTAVNEQESL